MNRTQARSKRSRARRENQQFGEDGMRRQNGQNANWAPVSPPRMTLHKKRHQEFQAGRRTLSNCRNSHFGSRTNLEVSSFFNFVFSLFLPRLYVQDDSIILRHDFEHFQFICRNKRKCGEHTGKKLL